MSGADRCEATLTLGSRTAATEDRIVLHGRCHHPHDIEVTAEQASPALRPGCSAAFTTLVGEREVLVLAHEVNLHAWPIDVPKVAHAIRAAVASQHGIPVYAIVLLLPHSLPAPLSGTIQRGLCAEMYGKGQLPELSRSVLDDAGSTGTSRLPHATRSGPGASRWYRWVSGSRSPIANVLDREFCFPRVLGPQASARRVTTSPQQAG